MSQQPVGGRRWFYFSFQVCFPYTVC